MAVMSRMTRGSLKMTQGVTANTDNVGAYTSKGSATSRELSGATQRGAAGHMLYQ